MGGQAQRLFNMCLSCHTAGCHFIGAYHNYAPPVQHALHALHSSGLCIPSTWLRSNGKAICLSMALRCLASAAICSCRV